MSTLSSTAVSELLERLFAAADQNDPAGFGRARDAMARLEKPPSDRQRAELMRDVYMPVSPDVGRLLYLLTRSRNAGIVVEFGTSYGISGIHLAAALRDAGHGRLITTEFDAIKAARAAENFRTAGLADLIEIRIGDAFETLKTGIAGGIDLVLLDGWKPLYLSMLKFLEPRLAPGALPDRRRRPRGRTRGAGVLSGLCARAKERLCVGRGSARRPARSLGARPMRLTQRRSTAASDVEGKKPGQGKAHQQHRPVREIQTEKPTMVGDTRLHDSLQIFVGPTAGVVACKCTAGIVCKMRRAVSRKCSGRVSAPAKTGSSR